MSYTMNGKKYADLAEITLYCNIAKTLFWEAVEKGIVPKPIYIEQSWYPYWDAETIIEFKKKFLQ